MLSEQAEPASRPRRYTPPSSVGVTFYIHGEDIRFQILYSAASYTRTGERDEQGRFKGREYQRAELGGDANAIEVTSPVSHFLKPIASASISSQSAAVGIRGPDWRYSGVLMKQVGSPRFRCSTSRSGIPVANNTSATSGAMNARCFRSRCAASSNRVRWATTPGWTSRC